MSNRDPVIVTVPGSQLGDVDIAVHHREWGTVEVDVRPAGTSLAWTPIALMGGSFTEIKQ